MIPKGFIDIPVELTDVEATHLVLAGMFTRKGKVLVITPKGSEWLKAYCNEKIQEEKVKQLNVQEVDRQITRYGSVDKAWQAVYRRYGITRAEFRAYARTGLV